MTSTDYEACTDCTFHIAYGNHCEEDEAFEPEKHAERLAEILAGIAALPHHALDLHAHEQINEFSKSSCEICGTRNHGERHKVSGLSRD